MWENDRFAERLHAYSGGPWTLFEGQRQLDNLVLQPLPLSADSPWADFSLFLDFLSGTFQRRLLRCFIGNNALLSWTIEQLSKQVRPPSLQALADALEQCCFWQFAYTEGVTWRGHPRLATLNNFGWSFEWAIQAHLERSYNALVRRHVIIGELAALGEIDLLAFLDDGRAMICECKSSSKGLTDRQLDRFLAKVRSFPATRALLLIDSDDQQQMMQRLGQLGQAMYRMYGDATIGTLQQSMGSHLVQLNETISIADTGGGLLGSLQAVLGDIQKHS